MKKLFIPLCLILLLTACSCKHEWTPATCTEPQTCEKCGMVEGEALGHSWTEATCTEPETCQLCGETKGEALGHRSGAELRDEILYSKTFLDVMANEDEDYFKQAVLAMQSVANLYPEPTCTTDGTCAVCQAVRPALGHAFIGRLCLRCGLDAE